MSDVTDLIKIKIDVLKGLESMFPNTVINAFENDYLCYWAQRPDGSQIPIIDFTRQMPYDINTYQRMINKSFSEWAEYLI